MKNLMLVLICLFMVVTSEARTITVNDDGPADFVAIQAAIDDSNDGDTVVVAPGRYYENINFLGKAITLTSTNPDDPNIVATTIIDGNSAGSVVTFIGFEGNDSILAGLTITNGSAEYGGGINGFRSSPIIRNCVISHNVAPGLGGGIYRCRGLIHHCRMIANVAQYGGGVYEGGRLSSCTIQDNVAHERGGGIYYCRGEISNCIITGNQATRGAGVCNCNHGIRNCTISDNVAKDKGGGLYDCEDWCAYDAEYCEFWATNCIIWGNEPDQIWYSGTPRYSCVEGILGGIGNISANPLFVNPAANNYHLSPGSPCINAGHLNFVAEPNETDVDGEPRIYAFSLDMGADEHVGYLAPIADAGDDQYSKDIQMVTLDGSGSFFADPAATREFLWAQTSGPTVELSDPAAEQTTFIPPLKADYTFQLVVSDARNSSGPDEVLIVVGNRAPVADAGSNTVCQVGEQISLDGRYSYDPDPGDVLTYNWTQLEGPNVVLFGANTPTASFNSSEEAVYAFQLVVSDGFDHSEPSLVRAASVTAAIDQQEFGFYPNNPIPYIHHPDVSGTRIACRGGDCCRSSPSLECIDLDTGQTTVAQPHYRETLPRIDGDVVVWTCRTGGPDIMSLAAKNVTTGSEVYFEVDKALGISNVSPAISGDTIVWLEHHHGSTDPNPDLPSPYNIVGTKIVNRGNLTFSPAFTIAENVGSRPVPSSGAKIDFSYDFDDVIEVCGNIVVWEGWGDIYGADISDLNDIRVFPICTNPARQYDPAVSGYLVAWTDQRNDGGDIYGADISDPEHIRVFPIIRQIGIQEQPALDHPMMVYVDVKDGLNAGQIKVCCLTRHYGALNIEIPGSPYGMGPAIDGKTIVWQGSDYCYGTGEGIYLEMAYTIADGAVKILATGGRYDYIQHAVDTAVLGDEIVVFPGTYYENINFSGKEVVVRSSDPTDPSVVAATIINGRRRGPVVTFESGEIFSCVLRGFTIEGAAVINTPLLPNMGSGGGAIACFDLFRRGPVISDCIVTGNDCPGLYCYRSGPTVINCSFAGNDSDGVELQGRTFATLMNCTIVGNGCYGIFDFGGGWATVTNCTIAGNVLSGIASNRPTVSNCILWNNASGDEQGQQIIDFGRGSVTYSNVQGGWAGEGNIDTDPCFVSWGYWDADGVWTDGDYHLQPDSPCIDAADNTAIPPDRWDLDGDGNTTEPITSWDLDANPRLIDYPSVPDTGNGTPPIVDMGAYEAFLPPLDVQMRFTPQAVNPCSKGKWVKAHFVLPPGFAVEDVDTNSPATIKQFGIESGHMDVFVNQDHFVEVEATFSRADFCSTGQFAGPVFVEGLFVTGQLFRGEDHIRTTNNNLQCLATVASYWLETACSVPDWCDGVDINKNSVVNFLDFASVDGCCVEVLP